MVIAESYFHTLNPYVVHFTSDFGIRWYGLSYAVAFVIGWAVVRFIAGRGWSPLPVARVGDFMFAAILGVLLGGRLGYAIFYEPHLFVGFSNSAPYWDLLAINHGGMASHGGMIGVIIACFWFGRRHGVAPLHLFDICGLGATIGLGIGRIANFINGELWGRAIPASMQSYVPGKGLTGIDPPWWSIKYPQEVTEHWVNIAAAPGKYATDVAHAAQDRLNILADKLSPVLGTDHSFYDRVVQTARDAGSTAHDQVATALKPLLTAFYPSQIFQAVTDGPILFTLLALIWLRPRKPGVIAGWFLVLYGVLRIITEMYREPDAGVELTFGLLSRGQTLSVLMVLGGALVLWLANRRDVPRIGGLLARGRQMEK